MARSTAITPKFVAAKTAAAGTVNAGTATLISISSFPEVKPDGIFVVNPNVALAAGVAIGQPYCVTAGTLVVPFINPTGGNVVVGDVVLNVVGL